MRSFTNTERDLLGGDFVLHRRLSIADASGTLRQITGAFGVDWVTGASGSLTLDQPVSSAVFRIVSDAWTEADGFVSYAPLVGASPANSGGPAVWPHRRILYETAAAAQGVAPASGAWRSRFEGYAVEIDARTEPGIVTIQAQDLGLRLARASIKNATVYGTPEGQYVGDVLQQMIDDAIGAGAVTLVDATPDTFNWVVKEYQQDPGYLLDALRNVVLQFGGDVRYRYLGSNNFPVFALTIPARDNATPAVTFLASEYTGHPRQSISDTNVRNVARVSFTDIDSGDVLFETATNGPSVAEYDERFMEIGESATSNIDTADEAAAMATAAVQDLGEPYASSDYETFDFWPADVADVLGFGPNASHDATQIGAITDIAWNHPSGANAPIMRFAIRGRPAAAYRDWLLRAGKPATPGEGTPLRLVNFREKSRSVDGRSVTYEWDAGDLPTRGKEIHVFQATVPDGAPEPRWPDEPQPTDPTAGPTVRLTPDTREFTIDFPPLGQTRYTELRPVTLSGTYGDAERVTTNSVGAPPRFGAVTQTPSVSGLATTITVEVIDPQARGGVLTAWLNHDAPADASASGGAATADGTITLASTPRTVVGADVWTTPFGDRQLFTSIRVDVAHGKAVFLEFVNALGVTTGVQRFTLLGGGGVIDAAGNIVDAGINAARNFAAGLRPPRVLPGDLPADGAAAGFAAGEFAIPTAGPYAGRLMRWTGTAWAPEIDAVNLSGTIVASQIADSAINTAKFAAGIKPVRLIANRTVSGTTGEVAYDLATNTLVRYTGTGWTDSLPTSSLTGLITAGQMAANSISANALQAGSVIVGKVQAGAIGATEIAADAIRAYHLFAGSVTTTALNAGAVTTTKLATDSVTAVKILAGEIRAKMTTTDKLIAAAIEAGAINSVAIQAGAVKATHLEISVLSDVKDAFGNTLGLGIIVSGRLQSVDGTRYLDLNATGALPFIHHPQFDLLANGNASFSGTVASSAFIADTATFARQINLGGTGDGFLNFMTGGLARGSIGPNAAAGYDLFIASNAGVRISGSAVRISGNLGFFNASPVSKRVVSGTTVEETVSSLLDALTGGTGYNLLDNVSAF